MTKYKYHGSTLKCANRGYEDVLNGKSFAGESQRSSIYFKDIICMLYFMGAGGKT